MPPCWTFTIHSPNRLAEGVRQTATPFETFFTTLVRLIIDGPYVVGRWLATGKYRGGIPEAEASFGTDILWVKDGKIFEYWLRSDTSSLLAQLRIEIS